MPPGGGNGKLFAIIGVVVAVLGVGRRHRLLRVQWRFRFREPQQRGLSQSGEGSAEQEVRDFLDEVMSSSSDLNEALPYFARPIRTSSRRSAGWMPSTFRKTTDSSGTAEITKITVNGNKAVVDISSSAGPGKLYLRKESGSWKICMSDMPGMPSMP